MTDHVAVVLDGLSRRDHGTRPEDLVFTLGFNGPFHQDTVRKRFYVAAQACRPRCPPLKGRRQSA
jgi:hypothetical protein